MQLRSPLPRPIPVLALGGLQVLQVVNHDRSLLAFEARRAAEKVSVPLIHSCSPFPGSIRRHGLEFQGLGCRVGLLATANDNRFPTVGGGVQYLLKPAQGMVANLEAAVGKDGSKALIFQMGYAW